MVSIFEYEYCHGTMKPVLTHALIEYHTVWKPFRRKDFANTTFQQEFMKRLRQTKRVNIGGRVCLATHIRVKHQEEIVLSVYIDLTGYEGNTGQLHSIDEMHLDPEWTNTIETDWGDYANGRLFRYITDELGDYECGDESITALHLVVCPIVDDHVDRKKQAGPDDGLPRT